jgi:hypothetical protein
VQSIHLFNEKSMIVLTIVFHLFAY